MASTRLYKNNTESNARLPTMSTSKRSASCSPAWRSQCSRSKGKSVKYLRDTGGTTPYSGSRSENDKPQGESYEKVMGRITDLPFMVNLKRSGGSVPAKGLPNTKSESGAMATPKSGYRREITRSTSFSSMHKLQHVDSKSASPKPTPHIGHKDRMGKDKKSKNDLSRTSQAIKLPGYGENDLSIHRSERVPPGCVLLDLKSEQESLTTSRFDSDRYIQGQEVLKKMNSSPVEPGGVDTNNQISEDSTTLSVISSSEMCFPECTPPEKKLDWEIGVPLLGIGCEQVYRNGLNEEIIIPMSDAPIPRLSTGEPRMSSNQKGTTQTDGKLGNDLSHTSQVVQGPGHSKNDLTMYRSERVPSSSSGYVLLDLNSGREMLVTPICDHDGNAKRQGSSEKNNSPPVDPGSAYPCKHDKPKNEVTTGSRRTNEMNNKPVSKKTTPMPLDAAESKKLQSTSLPRTFDATGKSGCYLPGGLKFVDEIKRNPEARDEKADQANAETHPSDHNTEESTSTSTLPTSERSTGDPVFYVLSDNTFDESPHITSKIKVQLEDTSKTNMETTEQTSQVPRILYSETVSDSPVCYCLLADNSMGNLRKVLLSELAATLIQSKEDNAWKIEQGIESEQSPTSWYDWGDLSPLITPTSIRLEPTPHLGDDTTRLSCTSDVETLSPQVMATGPLQVKKKNSCEREDRGDQDERKSFHDRSSKQLLRAIEKSPIPIALSSIEGPSDTELKLPSFETKEETNTEVLKTVNLQSSSPVRYICSNTKTMEAAQRIRPESGGTETPKINVEKERRIEEKEESKKPANIVYSSDQNETFSPEDEKVPENALRKLEDRGDQDERKSFHDRSSKQLLRAIEKSPIPIALSSIEGPSDTELKLPSFETKEETNTEVLKTVNLQSSSPVRYICSNTKTMEAAQRIRPESGGTETPKINVEKERRIEEKEESKKPANIVYSSDQNETFSPEDEKVPENALRKLSIGAQEKLLDHNEPKSDAAQGTGLKVDAETQTPCPENNATNCLEGHIRIRAKMRVRKRNCNRQKGDGRRTHTDSTDDRGKQGLHINSATTRMKDTKGDDHHQEDRQSIFEEEPEQESVTSNVILNQAQEGPLRQEVHEVLFQKASATLWGVENVSKYARKPIERTDPVVVASRSALDVTEAELMDDLVGQLRCLEMVSPNAPEWDQSDMQAESSTAGSNGWETPADFREAFSSDIERCLMGCKPIDSPAISEVRTEVSTQTLPTIGAPMNQSESEDNEPETSSDCKWDEVTQPISMTGRVGSVSSSIALLRISRISQFKKDYRETMGFSGCREAVKLKSISDSEQKEANVDLPKTTELFATELLPAVELGQSDTHTKSSSVNLSGRGTPQKSLRVYNEHLSDAFATSKVDATSSTRILPSFSTPILNTNTAISETETKRLTSFLGIERKDFTQRISTTRGEIISATSTTSPVSQSKRSNGKSTRVVGAHLATELRCVMDLEHVDSGIDLPETMEFPETELFAEPEPDHSEVCAENSTAVSSQWSPRIDCHKRFDLYAESVAVKDKPVDTMTTLRMPPPISSPLLRTTSIPLEHDASKPATSAIRDRKEVTEQMLINRGESSMERSVVLLNASPILWSTRGNKDISGFHLAVESKSMLYLEHVEPGVDPPEAVRLLETELLAGSERDESDTYNENSWSSDELDIEEESPTISLSGSDDIACFSSVKHDEMASPSQPNVKSSRASSQMGDTHKKAPSFTSIATSPKDPVTFLPCLPHSLRSSTRVEQQIQMTNMCAADSVHWNRMGARAQSSVSLSAASSIFSPPWHKKSTFFVSPETNSSHFPSSTSCSCPRSIVRATKLRAYPTAFLTLVAPCPIYYQIPVVVAVPRFFIYSSTSPQALAADARSATEIVSVSPHRNVNEQYDDTSCSPAIYLGVSPSDTRPRSSSSLPSSLDKSSVPSSKTSTVPQLAGLEKSSSMYRPYSLSAETSPGLSYGRPLFLSSAVGKSSVSKRTSMDDLHARLSKTPKHYSSRDLVVSPTATPMHGVQVRANQDAKTFLIRHSVRVSQNTPVQTNEERENSATFTFLDSVPPSYSAPYYYAYESYSSTTDDVPSLKTDFASTDGPREGRVSPATFEHGVEESMSTVVCQWSRDMPHSIRASLTYTQRVHDLVTVLHPEVDSPLLEHQLCESGSTLETSATESFSNLPEKLASDLQRSVKDTIVVSSYISEQPVQISGSVEYHWPLKETAFSSREYQHLGSTRPSVFSSFRLPLLHLPTISSKSCTQDNFPDQDSWTSEPLATQLGETPIRLNRSSLATGPPSNSPHAMESKSTGVNWDTTQLEGTPIRLNRSSLATGPPSNSPHATESKSTGVNWDTTQLEGTPIRLNRSSLATGPPSNSPHAMESKSTGVNWDTTQLEGTPIRLNRSSLATGPPSNSPHAMESKSTGASWDSRRQSSSSLKELRKVQLSEVRGHDLPYRISSSGSLSTKPSVSDYSEHREGSHEKLVHPFEKELPLSGDRRSSCSVRRRTTHDSDVRKDLRRCQCCRLQCKRCTRKPTHCECVLKRSCHCPSRDVCRRRSYLGCLTESCPHTRSRCILGAFTPNFGCLSLERTRLISVSNYTRNIGFICSAPCLDQDFGFHAVQTRETEPVYVRCQTVNKILCTHGCGRTNIPRHHMCYFGK
ncbi:hypothetical protein T265_04878 [Opisthorchis viverrini]|uniref:Uncharacterized protein n=1 Tax=Opisthorchis viverrini TaxID=6198 RepID=A0A074ZYA0_OPIVI|nr:hypothetical protein T265_04878 [Opisthorchis viverrini]KER28280.1 hypothetical protein T265_04878 [Opisthorchis viverrini]